MPKIISYALLMIKHGLEHEIADEIKKITNVEEVLIVYGMFDVIVRIVVDDLSQLDAII
ncbi:MAG: Lrp/AsnC ligand binding domain-containing protein, partial [Candidatus Odinarchaeia archaeon]